MGERNIGRDDPAGESIRLCNWIAGHADGTSRVATFGSARIIEIGERALSQYADRIGVVIAVARLFIAARENVRAINVLVHAAKIAPSEPLTFRLLGEILLGCGDVVRAERMLDRAVGAGMTDPETLALRVRARKSSVGKPAIPAGQTLPPPAIAPTPQRVDRPRPPADSHSSL